MQACLGVLCVCVSAEWMWSELHRGQSPSSPLARWRSHDASAHMTSVQGILIPDGRLDWLPLCSLPWKEQIGTHTEMQPTKNERLASNRPASCTWMNGRANELVSNESEACLVEGKRECMSESVRVQSQAVTDEAGGDSLQSSLLLHSIAVVWSRFALYLTNEQQQTC